MSQNLSSSRQAQTQALESQFGLRVASRLNAHRDEVPGSVAARLDFAVQQALSRQKKAETAPVTVTASQAMDMGGVLALHGGIPDWKSKLPSLLPLLALLLGLAFVQWMHMDDQIRDAAEVDSALLADDLPPEAYSDPGFAEYLEKTVSEE
ncbi:MAG: DUF3619 family protein [Burkholderiaceae bacterium]|nr:MAG: DUF3619 family protein [Burkholderiaceae bacterium]